MLKQSEVEKDQSNTSHISWLECWDKGSKLYLTVSLKRVGFLLGFVEPSYVWSDWQPYLTLIMLHGFLMGDLLRLSPWSGGLGRQAQAETLIFSPFCNSLWILCARYRNRFWWLGFCCCRSWEIEGLISHLETSSIININRNPPKTIPHPCPATHPPVLKLEGQLKLHTPSTSQ